jgi:type VI secretion system protein ImpF
VAERDALFWPSLYGRLAPSRYRAIEDVDFDEERAAREDPADTAFGLSRFFVPFEVLRAHVEKELQALLNATCLESVLLGRGLRGLPADAPAQEEHPFAAHPHVRASIVNYGLPAFVGRNIYAMAPAAIEERLRRAVEQFEPRIRPETMRVRVIADRADRVNPDQPLEFVVEGEIVGAEQAMRIVISTTWDPEKVRTAVSNVDVGR